MDLRTIALWAVAILVAFEIMSFYVGIPHDTLLQSVWRQSNQGTYQRGTSGPVPYCPQHGRMVRCD